MTRPRRVLISWDHCADGIWLVTTKEELEAATYEEWSRITTALHGPPGTPPAHRPWGDLLSDQLLDDLKAWNDSCDWTIPQPDEETVDDDALGDRGRELAVRVQDELGTDGWEVLYHLGDRVHRVHPPGSWPAGTWEQDLLGYPPRGRLRQQGKKSTS
ncbi:MAG TPA: hypothetical protein DHU96_13230 [Actinobacteria bacterium]|nr:hypothetical protein [Actinomycetota bacterium]